jgi:hypothetical protein
MQDLFDFDTNFDPIDVADISSTYAVGHAEGIVLPVPTPATALVRIVSGSPLPSM